MKATYCLDTYWRFAAERQEVYHRRLADPIGPWTQDPILSAYRFTNAYRASDRVSQFLIKEVQYHPDRSPSGQEVFFRTMLFKLFNSIETWKLLEETFEQINYLNFDFERADAVLHGAMDQGKKIYSAAYIMPDISKYGGGRKHTNHLRLLERMMRDHLPNTIECASSLQSVYKKLLEWPGLGPFLAFQYTIDLNYSTLINHDESSFVVCGPGALDGISKCFLNSGGKNPEDVVMLVTQWQEHEFERLGLKFRNLFGRRLQPIDCQNLFCEISKYSRVAHPELAGAAGRTKIKQSYSPTKRAPMEAPFFPPKWGINAR